MSESSNCSFLTFMERPYQTFLAEGYVKFLVSMIIYSLNPPFTLRVPLHKSCQVLLQNNELHCGLFLLHYIHKFVESAPKTMKASDFDIYIIEVCWVRKFASEC